MARRGSARQGMTNKISVSRNGNNSLDEILRKSAKLMARQGYHGTSMRDLAETTGHSLSGLYHYLKSKDDLVFKINERGFTSLLETSTNVLEMDISPADKLRAVISNHIEFFSGNMSEMRVMMFGTHDIDRKRSQIISKLKDNYASIVRQAVQDYLQNQSDKQFSESEISRKTYLLFGMMNWIYGWYSKNEHGSSSELANDIYVTFTQGCLG
jgi:TetR/AcrR family transcriptional regulator, cholesterol catabolism regulator